jgi:hypothetical protein
MERSNVVWDQTRKSARATSVLFTAVLGILTATSLHAQPQEQTRGSENFGLRGPVHIVVQTSKELNPDPRKEQRLSSNDTAGWLEFDDHGSFLAQGTDLSKMSEVPHRFYVYDAQGRFLEMGSWPWDGSTLIRQVYKYGPFGPAEVSWYAADKFTGHTTIEYDEQGNSIGDKSYDAEGHLTHQSIEKHDAQTGMVETQGIDAEGQSEIHVTDSANDKSAIIEHNTLDENGRIVNTLRLYKGQLVSWWLIPDFKCPEGQTELGIFNWNESELRFQTYFTLRCPRTLEITMLHHAGETGDLENDYEERRTEDGALLERIEFEYVRDTHDNWTERLMKVWDAKSNDMIRVKKDFRDIAYFGEEKSK